MILWYLKNIMLSVLMLMFCIQTAVAHDTNDNLSQQQSFYSWIEKEKIRAGYIYYYNPVTKISLIKDLGLNTIILKCWKFSTIKDRLETSRHIQEWARAAKQNNLHLFVAINWQPYPYMDTFNYKTVVYDDGTKGIQVNPLDNTFWEDHLRQIVLLVADLSNQDQLKIDGIFLDMEIYGSEKEPNYRRDYYEKLCGFSDICFSKYLIHKQYSPSEFPALDASKRKNWLEEQNWLDEYYDFLRCTIRSKAVTLREEVHKINPNFMFGMYPHPTKNNWVQYPLAQGFSSEEMPFVIFGIHSYGYNKDKNGDGYTFIPEDIKEQYHKDDINSIYVAGFLLDRYDGIALKRNLSQVLKYWDGYWLYKLPPLWGDQPKTEKKIDVVNDIKSVIVSINADY